MNYSSLLLQIALCFAYTPISSLSVRKPTKNFNQILIQSLHLEKLAHKHDETMTKPFEKRLNITSIYHITEEDFDRIYDTLYHKKHPSTDATRNHFLYSR